LNNLFGCKTFSGELVDGTQETPPALPFRYPGNFIRESESDFDTRFPIPKRENLGFVTHTHPLSERCGIGVDCSIAILVSVLIALPPITIQIVNRYLA